MQAPASLVSLKNRLVCAQTQVLPLLRQMWAGPDYRQMSVGVIPSPVRLGMVQSSVSTEMGKIIGRAGTGLVNYRTAGRT